jgi:hypothetical protein
MIESPGSRRDHLFAYGAVCLLLVFVWALYRPGVGGGFSFDDFPNIVLNKALHVDTLVPRDWLAATFSSPAADLPRPLAMLTFAINHYFTGLDPRPMKMTNIAVHLANTLLLFALLRNLLAASAAGASMGRRDAAALFATACWALAPINLMPALLVVQRMESLANLFVFGGLLCYVKARASARPALPVLAILGVFTVAGISAKESAALLPLYAFLVECFVLRFRSGDGSTNRRLVLGYVFVLLLPAIAAVAWLLPKAMSPGAYASRDFTLLERLATEPRVLVDYLRWTLLPDAQDFGLFHDDYPVTRSLLASPVSLLSLLLLAGMAVLSAWLAPRRPLAGLGLAWFLCAHLLTATFIPLELVFEHRNYFASVGLVLVLMDLFVLLPQARTARILAGVFGGLFLVQSIATTRVRVNDWSSPFEFARSEAQRHPASPRAAYAYAQALAIATDGKPDSAVTRAAFAAYDRAKHLPGSDIAPIQGALLLAGRTHTPIPDEWWLEMQARLRSRPISPQDLGSLAALTNCAISGVCDFPPGRMVETFLAALSHGEHPEVVSVYGNYAYNGLRDAELGERLWREAARLSPLQPEYRITLVKMLIHQGKDAEARREIQKLAVLGRYGQYRKVAAQLEARADKARRERGASAPLR